MSEKNSSPANIAFNRPFASGNEFDYIREACMNGHISGDGPFTRRCQDWLRQNTGSRAVLLTTSGTSALEMAAILADISPGDEVILPSFTFVSTANAFVLRGAVPVFVDIRENDLNIDESLIEAALSSKTRAVVPVHYGGVGCDMDAIQEIATRNKLTIIEDAAQGICAKYRDRPLGSIGSLGALSFHETKNLISGEGGALLVNDPAMIERAEVIWQKGTNRKKFLEGSVDKYTWVDIGSSFLPSDLVAAYLLAQLESSDEILAKRLGIWNRYHRLLEPLEREGLCVRPKIPERRLHNGHIYYLVIDPARRAKFIQGMMARRISAIFHYVPLHSSPAGLRYGRIASSMKTTDRISQGLVRLPIWIGLSEEQQDYVIRSVYEELGAKHLAP